MSLSAHGIQGHHHICAQLVGEGKSERKLLDKQFLFKQVMGELHTSLVLTVQGESMATEPCCTMGSWEMKPLTGWGGVD